MWVFIFYNILILSVGLQGIKSFQHGHFWHISDLHVDQNYSRTGNPLSLCHSEDGETFPDNGLYGNFLCDSPQYLINVTVASMKQIHPFPDFVIWTGDNLPHTADFNPDWGVTFEAIYNCTQLLISTFPGVPILPCIGNHDTFPPNLLPSEDTSGTIYKGYLENGGWDKLIPKEEWSAFTQGGYFSMLVKPNLRIISLNTILWYTPNNLTEEIVDPGNQFKWLEELLKYCFEVSEKVYIIGHVAPGFYNRVVPGSKSDSTYHPQHLKAIINILNKYSKIIVGQMYGHLHMDTFTISQYNTRLYKGSALLASSVTPWHSIYEYNATSIPVNPSVRLMHYSPHDASLLDYDQFYFNLTKANTIEESSEEHKSPLYQKLYTFTEFYKVQDLSTPSLVQVYEKLKNDPEIFNSFYKFLSGGKLSTTCDNSCKDAQFCAMSCTSTAEYEFCMRDVDNVPHITQRLTLDVTNVNSVLIFGSAILGVIILALVGFVLFKKFRKTRNQGQY